jgi:hypothetical protein
MNYKAVIRTPILFVSNVPEGDPRSIKVGGELRPQDAIQSFSIRAFLASF